MRVLINLIDALLVTGIGAIVLAGVIVLLDSHPTW